MELILLFVQLTADNASLNKLRYNQYVDSFRLSSKLDFLWTWTRSL